MFQPLILQSSQAEKSEPETEHESNRILLWIGISIACLMKTVSCWQMASILVTAIAPTEQEYWCARPRDQKNISALEWINNTHVWDSDKVFIHFIIELKLHEHFLYITYY